MSGMSVPSFVISWSKWRNGMYIDRHWRTSEFDIRLFVPTFRSDLIFVGRRWDEDDGAKTIHLARLSRRSTSSRFSKLARREAAVGHRGRPIDPPQDGSMLSPTTAACCPNWTLACHQDARTLSSGMPLCRGPRPARTASADSRLVSQPPAPLPFVSWNTIERCCFRLICWFNVGIARAYFSRWISRWKILDRRVVHFIESKFTLIFNFNFLFDINYDILSRISSVRLSREIYTSIFDS